MKKENEIKCEICGKRATIAIRNMTSKTNLLSGFVEKKPLGKPHYFCDDHKREPQIIDITEQF